MFAENIMNKAYNDINPTIFGYQKCESGHFYGPATRFHWLFHFVVSGKGKFIINNKTYHLSDGDMFVIPPFVEAYYEADNKAPWEYIWVGFTGTPPLPLEDVYNVPKAFHIFEGMKYSHNLKKGKTEFILAKLWELFSVLMEEKAATFDPIDVALNIIHSEYTTPITVQQIADRIRLERTYFSNLFSKRLQISPKKYLLSYRMEQAATLLKKGYGVTVTAYSVGYQDVYTFSKMFKRHFAVSPTEYSQKSK